MEHRPILCIQPRYCRPQPQSRRRVERHPWDEKVQSSTFSDEYLCIPFADLTNRRSPRGIQSLYTILQILSVSLFEETPILQAPLSADRRTAEGGRCNQLMSFNIRWDSNDAEYPVSRPLGSGPVPPRNHDYRETQAPRSALSRGEKPRRKTWGKRLRACFEKP